MTDSLKKLIELRKETNNLIVEEAIQQQGQKRYEHGKAKYGVTLDRDDLHPLEWLQHFKEEMMDGIRYCEKLQRKLEETNSKYCPDPDNCNYSDCPTAFCDKK